MKMSLFAPDTRVEVEGVRFFRELALRNGYQPISLRSGLKQPARSNWQHGELPDDLLNVEPSTANTGVPTAGLRCVDVDVDDQELVARIVRRLRARLPQGSLVRMRPGSSRIALVYRAAEGAPGKKVIKGTRGKIEVLGAGQQLHVHGVHPSGVELKWLSGRGPASVPLKALPAVLEQQLDDALQACASLLDAKAPTSTAGIPDPGVVAANEELSGGIESCPWFAVLSPNAMSQVVKACLAGLDNRTDDPRDGWLRVLFSVADTERLGCPEARELALEWSRRGASWTSEADFDVTWNSYKPGGGVSIGTLLALARKAGVDLSPWRDAALANLTSSAQTPTTTSTTSPAAPTSARALPVAELPVTPSKRQWLHGTDVVRGAVSLLVAPGARGKSSWLVMLALACSSGRDLLGAHVFGGKLRVLLINAEDSTDEMALRFRAAMQHHGLTDADVPGLRVAGAERLSLSLLRPNGTSANLHDEGWLTLGRELDDFEPDVLILDPLVSLMGGVTTNDNAAAALFMSRLN